jgi:hypothetical protein
MVSIIGWHFPKSCHSDFDSWGAKPFPKGDRPGSFVVLASGFGTDPMPFQSAPKPACSAPR